jgi:cytochrome c oxidase subunit III
MTTAQYAEIEDFKTVEDAKRKVSEIAMLFVLVTFSMLFATLFLGVVMYRFTSPIWPPGGLVSPSLFIPTISSLIVGASSFGYVKFQKVFLEEKLEMARRLLSLTLLLGVGFIASQYVLWSSLKAEGIFYDQGIFGSILYGMTWIHVAHMVIGVLLLLWGRVKLALLSATSTSETMFKTELFIRNVGKFWHFLGIIWIIMYILIFAI